MKRFNLYTFETKTGVDFRIGNPRNGSQLVTTIEGKNKQVVINFIKKTINLAINSSFPNK